MSFLGCYAEVMWKKPSKFQWTRIKSIECVKNYDFRELECHKKKKKSLGLNFQN